MRESEGESAGCKIFIYAFIFFVLMLLAIFTLCNSAGISGYQILCYLEFNKEIQYFVYFVY